METEEKHTELSKPARSILWLKLLIIRFIEKERRRRDSSQYLFVSRPDYYSTT